MIFIITVGFPKHPFSHKENASEEFDFDLIATENVISL